MYAKKQKFTQCFGLYATDAQKEIIAHLEGWSGRDAVVATAEAEVAAEAAKAARKAEGRMTDEELLAEINFVVATGTAI